MGQLLSCILGPPPLPPLLKLPAEILLMIASQLSSSPESLVALSLTCKTLFSFIDRDAVKLCDQSRQHLLLLLEKDLGDRFFYCPACRKLHRFSQQWRHTDIYLYSCRHYQDKNCFKPNAASTYRLSYIHGHLVVNRHFHGSPKGLPLESVVCSAIGFNMAGEPRWQHIPSARIIGDELFLCITQSLAGREATLRDVIDRGWSGVCRHLAWDCFRSVPELMEPEEDSSKQMPLFQACHDVPGSCIICLTDYTITIERAKVDEGIGSYSEQVYLRPLIDGWSITITAYHQVGQCREPEGWKWTRFVEF